MADPVQTPDTELMDSAERELLRSTLRHVLERGGPADLPGALLAEGWAELVDTDPAAAVTILGEEAGRARSAAPVMDLAVLWGAGIVADATTVVIVDERVLAGAERADRFIRIADDQLTEYHADAATLTPLGGIDPSFGLQRVDVDGAGTAIGSAVEADLARAAGRRALASQMIGASEQMLTDTLAYVKERHQYGRAIGSFQSVKHRLADVAVATAAARSALTAAWEHAGSDHAVTLTIAAKCLAGRAHALASTHCFQVHGGIAFTAEHGFQQWVRRGLVLDLLLGGHEELTRELGRRLVTAGDIPRLPRLTDTRT